MKKMTLKMRLLGGLVAVSMLFVAGSCAQGADCDEVFQSTVTDTQLVSPAADDISLEVVNVEYMKVSWPFVKGAGGYQCLVQNINDEANPVTVVDDVMDQSSFEFKLSDDTRYAISVKTLGNKALNNAEATTTTEKTYFFGVEGMAVPADAGDIGAYIAGVIAEKADEWAAARAEDANFEVAFDLAPGGQYTMETEFDAGLQSIRVRALTPENRATVLVKTPFIFQAGLRLQNMNLDCSDFDGQGLVCMSTKPDASWLSENLGYMRDGSVISGIYCINKSVILNNCWVKNLPKSLLYDNNTVNCALQDFRIINCIIQCTDTASNAFIKYDKKGRLIRNMTIENSTIYNINRNGEYFIRFNNASNANPTKVYGDGATAAHTIKNCTFVQMSAKGKFGNNMPAQKSCTFTMTDNVLYDVRQVYQYLQRNTIITSNNTLWDSENNYQNNDIGGQKDSNGNPYCVKEDPGFTAPTTAIDFSLPNGGLNLKPTGAISSTGGDPRWLN